MPAPQPQHASLADTILCAIKADAVILTPNHRLAQALRNDIDTYHDAQGLDAWNNPTIAPINEWLTAQFLAAQDKGLSSKVLLTAFQERSLWQHQISIDPSNLSSDLSGPIQKAWNFTQLWQLAFEEPHFYAPDHLAFKQIAQQFSLHCKEQNFLCESQVQSELAPFFEQQQLSTPKAVLLYCFEELSPALAALLATFEQMGSSVTSYQPTTRSVSCNSVSFDTHQDEIKASAQWSANILEQHPAAKIGIVIPELAKEKPAVEHIFTEQFSPSYFFSSSDHASPIYNLSAGVALTKTPIVAEAIFLLELDPYHLSIEQISHLLLSPYVRGHQSESSSRALLDQKLRSAGLREYSVKRLLAQIAFQ